MRSVIIKENSCQLYLHKLNLLSITPKNELLERMISPLCISLVNPRRSALFIYGPVSPLPPHSHQRSDNPFPGKDPNIFHNRAPSLGVLFYFTVLLMLWCHWKRGTFTDDEDGFQRDVPPCTPGMCAAPNSALLWLWAWTRDMEKMKPQALKGELWERRVGHDGEL